MISYSSSLHKHVTFIFRKALEESLKFSTAPRMAAGTSHVVSFYNRPNRNEEMLARVCLKDGIRWDLLDVMKF